MATKKKDEEQVEETTSEETASAPDAATIRQGTEPRPAMPRNPAADYDDSKRG